MVTTAMEFKVSSLHKFSDSGNLRAFADVSINDLILVRGIKVVEGKKGLFVSMPQAKGTDDRWYDRVRCVNRDVFKQMERVVLEAYEK